MTVEIEPIQDLHGYDKPWPGGGGKNIGYLSANNIYSEQRNTNTYVNNGVVVTGVGVYARCGFSIPVVTGETYTISAKCKRGSASVQRIGLSNETGWGNTYGVLGVLSETLSTLSKTITATSDTLCIEVYPGSDSAVITIEDFQVEKNSSATPFAPYSNICPITGWTGMSVWRTGKNLLEPKFYGGIEYNPSIGQSAFTTLTDVTNTVTKDGNTYSKTGSSWGIAMNMVLPLDKSFVGKTLKFSGTINAISGFRCAWYITDAEHITKRKSSSMNELPTWSITIQEGDAYLIWFMNSSSAGTFVLTEPMIELGSTATPYTPYVGQTIPITWAEAGTVYGGTLDVTTGVLTVDRGIITLDGSQELQADWQTKENSTAWIYGYAMTNHVFPTALDTVPNIIASSCPTVTPREAIVGSSPQLLEVSCYNSSSIGIIFRTTDMTLITKSAIDTYLSANPIDVVFELATPQTYQLTAEEVTTLLGDNVIWADTGDSSVEYLEKVSSSKVKVNPLVLAMLDPLHLNDC